MASNSSKTAAEIERFVVDRVADLKGVAAEAVDVNASFAALGLDSVAAVHLGGELEDWLGLELPATITYDFPTIAKLSAYLGRAQ